MQSRARTPPKKSPSNPSGGKRRKPKCTRGKKICPECASLVPIHSFECKCGHKFDIKKKHKEDPLAVISVPHKPALPSLHPLSFDTHQPSAFTVISEESSESPNNTIDLQISAGGTLKTKCKALPATSIRFIEGKHATPDLGCDFALMLLPDCLRVIKFNWVFSANGSSEQYLWVLYETVTHQSSVTILRLTLKGNHVLSYEICYTVSFEEYISDADCVGCVKEKQNLLAMLVAATIPRNAQSELLFYNLPMKVDSSKAKKGAFPILRMDPIKACKAPTYVSRLSWNQQNPVQIAITDNEHNIYVIDIEKAKAVLKYHRAHTMEITKLLWIYEDLVEDSKKTFIATSSHDGNIKIWDLEDPFAPCFIHSTGQRWVYDIEWDPLLKILYYNSEGKNNSYSYLAFYGMQPPILKKYIVASQATLTTTQSAQVPKTAVCGADGAVYLFEKKRTQLQKKKKSKAAQFEVTLKLDKLGNKQFSILYGGTINPPSVSLEVVVYWNKLDRTWMWK